MSCPHGVLQCQTRGHDSFLKGSECQDPKQVGRKGALGRPRASCVLACSRQWVLIPSGLPDQSVAVFSSFQ